MSDGLQLGLLVMMTAFHEGAGTMLGGVEAWVKTGDVRVANAGGERYRTGV